MPKMKTNKGAAKRFKATGSGKISRSKACRRHILTSKSTKRKRDLRRSGIMEPGDQKRAEKLCPYF
ncbi:MAG: 50S ribosomal protein L35 [Nitrospinae bacterium]|nr:50S ribosomal protein L35 [Nitrospinota bacterium]